MTSMHQLERLVQLRRQRTRLAEEALAAGQRRCQDLASQRQSLEAALIAHQQASHQRDQRHFDASEHRPLDAHALADWQQTLADDAERRDALLDQRRLQASALRAAKKACDNQAAEWANRRRALQALEQLQADHARARAVDAEHLAELESEEMPSGRGERL